MLVVKTTSPPASTGAPNGSPWKSRPSSSASTASPCRLIPRRPPPSSRRSCRRRRARRALVPAELPDHVRQEELAREVGREDADEAEQVADRGEPRPCGQAEQRRERVLPLMAADEVEDLPHPEGGGQVGVVQGQLRVGGGQDQ